MLTKWIIISTEDGYTLEEAPRLEDTRTGYLLKDVAERAVEVLNDLKNAPIQFGGYSKGLLNDGHFKEAFNKLKDDNNKRTKREYRLGGK